MDKEDYNNLMFLLYSSPEVLADWYASVTDDDLKYASALLEVASLEVYDQACTMINDYSQAMEVINRAKMGAIR